MQYFVFAISISVISWIVGIIVNTLIKNQPWYKNLSYIELVKSKRVNKWMGIDAVKWIIINTPFKYFNPGLKVQGKGTDLVALRREMTYAEIGHLVGFVFVTFFALIKAINVSILFGVIIMMVNLLMNLYPSLLQQQNKKRIDRFINRKNRGKKPVKTE
jgi:uncharacterized protein YacL